MIHKAPYIQPEPIVISPDDLLRTKRYIRNLVLAIVLPALGYTITYITYELQISDRTLLWVGLPSFLLCLVFSVRAMFFSSNVLQGLTALIVFLVGIGLIAWTMFLWVLLLSLGSHMGMLWCF